MQTKSENHETCRGVVLSHVEAVVKNCEGFKQVVASDAKNQTSPHVGERKRRKRKKEKGGGEEKGGGRREEEPRPLSTPR